MKNTPLKIALLTHSTNPRGGVIHTLELADALARLGHEPVVFAPGQRETAFFRSTLCQTVIVPSEPPAYALHETILSRVADYTSYFSAVPEHTFDVWHAQDGISANALLALKDRRRIPAFARTVHHIDPFSDVRVTVLEAESIQRADQLFTVSRVWQEEIETRFSRFASLTGNGVDVFRFNRDPHALYDTELREKLVPGDGPIYLAIGGIEQRKNTIGILAAFAQCHAQNPDARLVIAGGASVLDHSFYRHEFEQVLKLSCLPKSSVIITGTVPDRLMPSLYRRASALVFPSLNEGFGLVVLEALACDVPVVASRIRPFTDFLSGDDVHWCDPEDSTSIAEAMLSAIKTPARADLVERRLGVARRHNWTTIALAHLPVYEAMKENCHA
ncbi:MSMEG_0565 family glycosyltransferase [Hyphomicrobium sp.]|jgi:glycosyltransferase-like protein|uniref:MSMEG_0565 family glycosyltransferase n=1 Tax=Hyphomicrobium sp. TaxID=82 RepID=UPI0035640706